MINKFYVLAICASVSLTACAPIQVHPELNSSLGLSAFQAMGKIDPQPIAVAVFLSPDLTGLTLRTTIRNGKFSFPVGRALSVKIIKALAYQFQTVYVAHTLAEARAEPVKAILTIKPGTVSAHFGVKSSFETVGTTAFVRLPIRAQLMDVKTGRVIWVGTSHAQESSTYEDAGKMGYQEAGTGFATAVDGAVDRTVGNLAHQLAASPTVANYAEASH